MKNLFVFFVLFSAFILSAPSFSATAPVTFTPPATQSCTARDWNFGSSLGVFPSAQAACSAFGQSVASGGGPAGGSGNCTGTVAYFQCSGATVTAPANSTCTGSSCTCDAGFYWDGTSCLASPNCPADGTLIASGLWDAGTVIGAKFPVVRCSAGCLVIFNGFTAHSMTMILDGVTHQYARGKFSFMGPSASGAPCVPSPGDATTPSTMPPASLGTDKPASGACPAGQNEITYQGVTACFEAGKSPNSCGAGKSSATMNGQTICLDSNTGLPVSTASASAVAAAQAATTAQQAADIASQQAAADAAAAAAVSASQKAQAAADAACTQAKTLAASSLASYGASSITATQDAAAASSACVSAAAGTAAAAAGAAAGAAAARAASGVADTQASICAKHPEFISCMTAEQAGSIAADTITEKKIDFSTFSFSTYSFSGNAACPAPRNISVMGRPIHFSYQPFCDFLNIFRLVALAVAFFIGGMIMMGQKSSDTGG